MKLYVYAMNAGVEKSWDDVELAECSVVAVVEGENNEDCENKAVENGYGDSDIFGWTYNDDVEMSDDVVMVK